MDRGVAVLLTVVVGGFIALQAPVNASLGKETGKFAAALVSFAVGTLVLIAIVSFVGELDGTRASFDVPWYLLTGGVLGVAYVTASLITVTTIGAGGVAAATIAGQLTASMLIDRLGFLGLEETPITPERLAGVALLAAGTYLIVK